MVNLYKLNWKWEDMCGPAGMQLWDDNTKDFGSCFLELGLLIPIYFIIAIISAYYVGYRRDWVIREKLQERAVILRSFVVLALAFIPIIKMYLLITKLNFVVYPIDYFTAGVGSLTWLVHFGYVLALKQGLGHSARGPVSLIIFWSVAVVLNVIALRSSMLNESSITFDVVTLSFHGIYMLTLIPSSDSRQTYYSRCLVGSQRTHSEYTPLLPNIDEGVLGTAMQGSSIFSKLTFSWVNPLIQKGLENKLQDAEELFDVPTKYRCSYIGARMDRALIGNVDNYQQFVEIPHEPFLSPGYGSIGTSYAQSFTPVTPVSRVLRRQPKRQNISLIRAMHSCFAVQFYSIGILKLVSDMAGFAGPMLLNKLVAFVENPDIDQHLGYLCAAGLFAASLISALFGVHFTWLMSMIGIKMRGAIVSTILRKTLSVTSAELKKSFSVGEITNFMSTDTDRIVNSCPSFHALWSIPLQLVITLILLYQQVGLSFLAGVGFSIVLIPFNKYIANKIGQLSTELMRNKDTRVSLISDILKGIRTIKVHVWEDYFINRVAVARREELRYLRGRKYLDAICVVTWATTPVMVSALTIGVHSLRGQPLDAPTVFTTVALINMLISPLNAFPWVLNGLTEAWVSIKRIQKLLDLPDMDQETYYDRINTNHDEDKVVVIQAATFAWTEPSTRKRLATPPKLAKNKGKSKKRISRTESERRESATSSDLLVHEPFILHDISLEIGRAQLVGVTGTVGSGKSSLLNAILGEMSKKSGSIQLQESSDGFGYVPQTPWLVRGTIRDNILFGKPYDENRFRSVIEACALTEDLNILGWNARVGEGGCTLSGGQRTRISLARSVYQQKQVYLLDDVLSGVDARVGQHIMQHCILGLLRHTARIIVTHSSWVLARTDHVVLIKDGRIVEQGLPEIVLTDVEEYLPSEPEHLEEEPNIIKYKEEEKDEAEDTVSRNSLDVDEQMSQGSVQWWVLKLYLKSVGGFLSISIILSLLLMQLSQNFTFVWLTFWLQSKAKNSTAVEAVNEDFSRKENSTVLDHGINAMDSVVHSIINMSISLISNLNGHESNETVPLPSNSLSVISLEDNGTIDESDRYYLEVYFGLAALNLVFTVIRAFLFAYGGVKAATKIHRTLLRIIIRAKMRFFDVTPIGRIVNRFSSDIYTVDDSLPFIMNILLAQTFGLIGAFAVTLYGIPWLLVGVIPLIFVYYHLQRRYRIASRQLKRLQSVTLSPVYAHFNDTLEGVTCIRAHGCGPRWLDRGEQACEAWQRGATGAAAAGQWLALRLQALAAAVVGAAAAVAVLMPHTHQPGVIGLALSYTLSLTSMLSGVLNAFTETEREMIAVERVGEYIRQVEVETNDGDSPPYGWPSQGVITFEDVVLKYSSRSEGRLALQHVSWSSRPGERVGVAGRSGAGKSSLLSALLRLAAPCGGRVLVDGVDLATLSPAAIRARISVIPQEPFIFGGTILENVDPLLVGGDAEVWRALERCGARQAVAERGGLRASAAALSRGLAQQLCLARAALQKHKILLVDEATANLDKETERLILDTIRGVFAGSTVIFVAHRISTVLECSRVLVMGSGEVLEFDTPENLLEDPTSQLYALAHAHED